MGYVSFREGNPPFLFHFSRRHVVVNGRHLSSPLLAPTAASPRRGPDGGRSNAAPSHRDLTGPDSEGQDVGKVGGVPSLKLTANAPENRPRDPIGKDRIPTIHFLGLC